VNAALQRLATDAGLAGDASLRLAFGLACVERVRHLLEEPRAIAVSATHALAQALAGRALEAADYAAYAAVYAYGRYAVNDPASFEPEYAWQADCLRRLVQARAAA
jgi:hypothetical protein